MVMAQNLQPVVQWELIYLNMESYTVPSLLLFWRGGHRGLWRPEVFLLRSLPYFAKAEIQHLGRLLRHQFLKPACLCCPPIGLQMLATIPGSLHGFSESIPHALTKIHLPTELSFLAQPLAFFLLLGATVSEADMVIQHHRPAFLLRFLIGWGTLPNTHMRNFTE